MSCSCSVASVVSDFAALWTVAHQAPLSTGFSRREYWSRLPFSPPGDPPDPGIEPVSLVSPALAGGFFTTNATWETHATPPPSENESLQPQPHPFYPGGHLLPLRVGFLLFICSCSWFHCRNLHLVLLLLFLVFSCLFLGKFSIFCSWFSSLGTDFTGVSLYYPNDSDTISISLWIDA